MISSRFQGHEQTHHRQAGLTPRTAGRGYVNAFRKPDRVRVDQQRHEVIVETDKVCVAWHDETARDADIAQIVRLYGSAEGKGGEKRYSPVECIGVRMRSVED